MSQSTRTILIEGLDPHGQEIIDFRLPIVLAFLTTCDYIHPQWYTALHDGNHKLLLSFMTAYEKSTTPGRLSDEELISLAEKLNLRSTIEDAWLWLCWRGHVFDTAINGKLSRPDPEDVFPKVREILRLFPYTGARKKALLDQNLCRDQAALRVFFHELAQLPKRMAGVGRGIVLAYLEFGPLGLLRGSSYPSTEELLRLQRYAPEITQVSQHPDQVQAVVRSDLIALYHAFHQVNPKFWKQHLVHEPPASLERQRYQSQLLPDHRQEIMVALAEQRMCSEAQVTLLLDTFLEKGLWGLIELRCSTSPQRGERAVLFERLRNSLDEHLKGIDVAARIEIERLLKHLVEVIEELQIPFPLQRLLRDHPSSPFRIRCGRRFSFGVGATQRRRNQSRKLRKKSTPLKSTTVDLLHQAPSTSIEDQLISRFAKRVGLQKRDARWRLRNLITYGAFGLLSHQQRISAIDPRLVSNLYLHKLGHLDGSISWSQLFQQCTIYAQMLNISPLSQQLAKGIFNSLEKPRYWHGGVGEATATARQRTTLILDVPRLHEIWIVVPVRLQLPIFDRSGYLLSKVCHVLVVIERATALPMGCWVSQHEPSAVEIGLALYQAIWHPGIPEWPIRGIPQILQIPKSLAREDLSDLHRAASFLLMEIAVVPNQYWSKMDMIKHLVKAGPDIVGKALGAKGATLEKTQAHLLTLLHTTWFSGHTGATVPLQLRERGIAMPGYDTPAAGWLLPVADQARSIRNGVVVGSNMYTHPHFFSEPGHTFHKRAFPLPYEQAEPSIFVEMDHLGVRQPTYLVRRNDRPPV